MSNELMVAGSTELTPEQILGKQKKIVDLLKAVIAERTVVFYDSKTGKESRHIEAMAWQAIASAMGCMPKIVKCVEDENGMYAECQLIRFENKEVVGENSAYVGKDELQWYGGEGVRKDGSRYKCPKKPFNQIRSCAQTRAIRQTVKVAFGHVAVLLNKELGIDTSRDAEDLEDEREILPPPTKPQLEEIKSKMKLSGVTEKQLVERFGPGEKLTQDAAKAVIAHLDGVIASQEGAKEG